MSRVSRVKGGHGHGQGPQPRRARRQEGNPAGVSRVSRVKGGRVGGSLVRDPSSHSAGTGQITIVVSNSIVYMSCKLRSSYLLGKWRRPSFPRLCFCSNRLTKVEGTCHALERRAVNTRMASGAVLTIQESGTMRVREWLQSIKGDSAGVALVGEVSTVRGLASLLHSLSISCKAMRRTQS